MNTPHVVVIDNRDSFVYNLVDALNSYRTTVFRNNVPAREVLGARPDLLLLSPGPGHPRQAGELMPLVHQSLGTIPMLGICLGFQALLEAHGGTVAPCGPVHGKSLPMRLTAAGLAHPAFAGEGERVHVARYHSLACTPAEGDAPEGMRTLATAPTAAGEAIMAAETCDGMALGLQFHPESILSPTGPHILKRCVNKLSARSSMGGN